MKITASYQQQPLVLPWKQCVTMNFYKLVISQNEYSSILTNSFLFFPSNFTDNNNYGVNRLKVNS
jgi:hypothetical protein